MKKAAKDDMSALSECQKMLSEVESLSSKIYDAEEDMTDFQFSRYMKITNKMTTAATSMY